MDGAGLFGARTGDAAHFKKNAVIGTDGDGLEEFAPGTGEHLAEKIGDEAGIDV